MSTTTPGTTGADGGAAVFRYGLTAQDALLVSAFLCSGVAALGLELIWIRVLGLAFGSENFGMLGVVAAFFAGLALGSAALQRSIVRSRRPIRIYIAAELIIAAYALAGPGLMLRLADSVPRVLGPMVGDNSSLLSLSLTMALGMVLLLPATFWMGATTVAIVEAWRRRRTIRQNATTVAWLYAGNTLGATLGIVLSTYWLMPAVGVAVSSRALALFSVAAAALSWQWERIAVTPPAQTVPEAQADAAGPGTSRPLVYGLLFCTGLAGVGIETVGTHVLSQLLENTVYTFANVLGVYLLGTAIGAWLYTLNPVRRHAADRDGFTRTLLYGLVITGVFSGLLLAHSGALMSHLTPAGASYARVLAVQTLVIAGMFLPVTIWMGATFSHLVGHFTLTGVGYAAAVNTAGATLAPFLFGLILIPASGYGIAFFGAVAIYVLLIGAAHVGHGRSLGSAITASALAAAAVAAAYSPLLLIRFPPNVTVLEQQIGLHGVVSVTEMTGPGAPVSPPRYLQVDQSYYMGATPGDVEKRMGHLPIILADGPHNVLYLGIGTGITASAALDDGVERVTAVDLLPEIVNVLPWFSPFNSNLERSAHATVRASDARRFIEASHDRYDAIAADLFHPSRDGTASLYTREHFQSIRRHLADGGVFVQWLPIYQMSQRDLKTIVRTFLDVFPDADSAIGSYSVRAPFGLVGRAGRGAHGEGIDIADAQAILQPRRGRRPVFDGLKDVLGMYMLDAAALARYAGPGPINTDDNQRITFDAAGAARIQDSPDFYKTLASLIPYRRPFPDSFVEEPGSRVAGLRSDVESYGGAGTHYLRAEVDLSGEPASRGVPHDAVDEYVEAYREDVRFISAPSRLLTLSVQYPATLKDVVDALSRAHPDQASMTALDHELDGVANPAQIRQVVLRFLTTASH